MATAAELDDGRVRQSLRHREGEVAELRVESAGHQQHRAPRSRAGAPRAAPAIRFPPGAGSRPGPRRSCRGALESGGVGRERGEQRLCQPLLEERVEPFASSRDGQRVVGLATRAARSSSSAMPGVAPTSTSRSTSVRVGESERGAPAGRPSSSRATCRVRPARRRRAHRPRGRPGCRTGCHARVRQARRLRGPRLRASPR